MTLADLEAERQRLLAELEKLSPHTPAWKRVRERVWEIADEMTQRYGRPKRS